MPRPLALLLGAVSIVLLSWALLTPPFMVPDESEHFAYVQSLAENGERPARGAIAGPFLSSEQRVARATARTTAYTRDLRFRPAWEAAAEAEWEATRNRLPRDDIRALASQSDRPPYYYALQVVPYVASPSDDPFDRLVLMRLWSALLMLVATVGAWLLIGELTASDRLLQLAGAACVGLQPMATFVAAGVNPDALLFAAYSVALWLMARVLRRGFTWAASAGLVAATLAALSAKGSGLALVAGVMVVLFVSTRDRTRSSPVAGAVAALAGLALAGVAVAVQSGLGDRVARYTDLDAVRGFGTYLWDFYLPRLASQYEYEALHVDNPVWTVWVRYSWGSFGQLEVQFPDGAYIVLAAVSIAVLALASSAVRRRCFEIGRATAAVFALVAVCLLTGLHWTDYQSVSEDGARVFQGRYLLPLMPIVGVAVAAALSNLSAAHRAHGAALVLGGMAVLALFSQAVVAGRYFA